MSAPLNLTCADKSRRPLKLLNCEETKRVAHNNAHASTQRAFRDDLHGVGGEQVQMPKGPNMLRFFPPPVGNHRRSTIPRSSLSSMATPTRFSKMETYLEGAPSAGFLLHQGHLPNLGVHLVFGSRLPRVNEYAGSTSSYLRSERLRRHACHFARVADPH